MRYAICNETYQGWSIEAVCADVAAAGYEAIEVAPNTLAEDVTTLSEAEGRAVGRAAADHGLEVVGLHWLLAGTTAMHLTSLDEAVRRRTIDHVKRLADCCGAMGGSVMVWGSPRQRDLADDQPHQQGFDAAVRVLRPASEAAGERNVTIALEPLPARETNFLNTAAEGQRLLEAVDHPACRLHLDVKAMSYEDIPIPDLIHTHAPHLAHFHANDPNLRGPGQGEVDFQPILAALQQIEYAGVVSVEVFDYTPDGPTIARQSLDYLRRVEATPAGADQV